MTNRWLTTLISVWFQHLYIHFLAIKQTERNYSCYLINTKTQKLFPQTTNKIFKFFIFLAQQDTFYQRFKLHLEVQRGDWYITSWSDKETRQLSTTFAFHIKANQRSTFPGLEELTHLCTRVRNCFMKAALEMLGMSQKISHWQTHQQSKLSSPTSSWTIGFWVIGLLTSIQDLIFSGYLTTDFFIFLSSLFSLNIESTDSFSLFVLELNLVSPRK